MKQDTGQTNRPELLRRGLILEYLSLTWNVLEAIVGFGAALASGSVALFGFALDSVAEASSAGILVWRLHSERGGRSKEESERRAVRAVGIAFIGLAVYVAGRAAWDLVQGNRPSASGVGIALAVVSLIIMPVLAWRKQSTARQLDSRALQADSKQTSLCAYLSAILLVGLGLNALFGWWWADPVAALAIAFMAAREGKELVTTQDFCCV